MTPDTMPLPEALPLPGPAWLLHGLLLLTFFLHLVPMNLMLGGAVFAAVARLRHGPDTPASCMAGLVGRALPTCVAAAVSFGVAALLFAQVLFGRLLFSSSILMAWTWFAVVPILIAAYYGSYAGAMAGPAARLRATLATTFSAALLLLIAFIYANNMSLMLRPDVFASLYAQDATGRLLNLDDTTLIPRYLHAVLGAFAVGGWGVALLAHLAARDADVRRWGLRQGFTWLAVATGLNVLAGAAWFLTVARPVRRVFHGGDMAASVVLALGVLLAFGLIVHAWKARAGDAPARALVGTGAMLGLTLALMVLTRDSVRSATLAPQGFTMVSWVEPQWALIAAFLGLLLVALGSVAWMVRALWTAGSAP